MKKYEMLYIIDAQVEEEAREAVIKKFEDLVTANGGTVEKTDKWGMKKLQYPINFKSEGYYVLMTFESSPSFVKELKRVIAIVTLAIILYVAHLLWQPTGRVQRSG